MVSDLDTKTESAGYDVYGEDFRWDLKEKNRLLLVWLLCDRSRPYRIKLVRAYQFSDSTPLTWHILNMDVATADEVSGRPVDVPQEIEKLNARLEELRTRKIES
jgi:hypothetical protein